jgi:glutamate carboxypeptidase
VEPDTGRNAVHAISREAVRLLELHHARAGLTFQLTGLEGGQGLNTVPSGARLTGDMRAVTALDLEWGMEQVRAWGTHDGISFELEELGGPPAFERTPEVATLAQAAIRVGNEIGHRFGEALTGGVSDGSWTADRGIPTLDGLGPVGGLDHGPDEYVETATFATRSGVVAGLVAAIDGGLLSAAKDRTKQSSFVRKEHGGRS